MSVEAIGLLVTSMSTENSMVKEFDLCKAFVHCEEQRIGTIRYSKQ